MSPQACQRCGTPAADDARFCASCGAPLGSLEGAERKLATMVFADLVGSTELASSLDPEELRRRLAPFFEIARATLEEHGGTVEKFVGDAVLAVFGVPRTHGDDPDRAVTAALELVDRVAAVGDGLAVRIGVETGEVLAIESAGDLSVTGEAVNAAARLQGVAAENEVLVGERAARSCREARLEPRGEIEAKGFPTPLQAWQAVAGGGAGPRREAPFIGRQDDIDLLKLVYRRAVRERLPELITITGDAGIGKTRLTSELIASLREAEPAPEVLLGRNPPYGRGIAFWALGEILRSAAGATADDSVAEVHTALSRRLRTVGADDAEQLATALSSSLGGDERDCDVEDELKRAWRRMVALLAEERPLVIGIDDAHWADDGLLDLFEEAAFSVEGAPLVLLCTSRPELLERRPSFGRAARNVTQIELRPLARDATAELAAALLSNGSPELVTRVAEVSGGNPFFAEEVAQRLVEDPEAAVEGRLPETIQAAIAARLDLLPPSEKRAIQYAGVLGPGFLEEALAELLGESPAESLEALARKALVQERVAEGDGRYGFRHQLIREVAYASLPKVERVRLHQRAADGILARAGEHHAELAELVSYHRVQAAELEPTPERSAEALQATLDAAEALFRRGASRRSQHLYEQAAELAGSPPERVEALRAASAVATRRFRGDEAVAPASRDGRRGRGRRRRRHGRQGICPRGRDRHPDEGHHRMAAGVRADRDAASRAGALRCRRSRQPGRCWCSTRAGWPGPSTGRTSCTSPLGGGSSWPVRPATPRCSRRRSTRRRQAPGTVGATPRRSSTTGSASSCSTGVPRSEPAYEIERSDALHMMVESSVQVGAYREALAYAARARDLDLNRGVVYSGWSRAMLPSFFLGEWDELLAMGKRVRDALTALEKLRPHSWPARSRPPAPSWATGATIAGSRTGWNSPRTSADRVARCSASPRSAPTSPCIEGGCWMRSRS